MERPTLNYAGPGVRREVGVPRLRLGRTLLVAGVICGVVLGFYCVMMPWEEGPRTVGRPAVAPPIEYRPPVDMWRSMRPMGHDHGGPVFDDE